MILVSTSDLLKYSPRAIYLNNPIDREHFKPVRDRQSNNNYLTMKTDNLDIGLLKNYLKSNNLEFNLQIHHRTANPIFYNDIPYFLNKFDTYVDIRFINNRLLENLSKTILECLACNLKVLTHDLKIINNFPQTHDGYGITAKLMSIIKSNS